MPILSINLNTTGLVGVTPSWAYIATNDTLAEVTTAGYLNKPVQNGYAFTESMMALVATKTTPSATSTQVGIFDVAKSGSNWSLTPSNSTLSLADGYIYVGNASGIAQAVAVSGDATISNTGVVTLNPNLLDYVTVSISAAAFNGMYAAPIQLVAAPGASKLLVLDKVQLLMTYNSAAYAAGGVAAVQYDSTINGAGVIASTTLAAATFQATASTAWNFNAGVVPAPFATCVNKGLYLSNITGAFTTGNSPMVAHVWYKTIASA